MSKKNRTPKTADASTPTASKRQRPSRSKKTQPPTTPEPVAAELTPVILEMDRSMGYDAEEETLSPVEPVSTEETACADAQDASHLVESSTTSSVAAKSSRESAMKFTFRKDKGVGLVAYGAEGVRGSVYFSRSLFGGNPPAEVEIDAPNLAQPDPAAAQKKAEREQKRIERIAQRDTRIQERAEKAQARAQKAAEQAAKLQERLDKLRAKATSGEEQPQLQEA